MLVIIHKSKQFDETNKKSDDSVVSGMQPEKENSDTEDANLVAGRQPCIGNHEPVKEDE